MKEEIKSYFEEAIQTDAALKEVYAEAKLDDCIKYIMKMARKEIKGQSGAIRDTVVYKWARDFMYGDIAEEDKVTHDNEEETNDNEEKTHDNVNKDTCGTCGNNYVDNECVIKKQKVESETPACEEYVRKATDEDIEKIQEEAAKPKKAKAKKKEEKKDDGQLFFDF